jgi:hypothetical protein
MSLPRLVIELVCLRGRKVYLQCHIMMFSVDYLESIHREPNRCTGRLHPIASRVPIRPANPYVSIYNASHKMNRRTA